MKRVLAVRPEAERDLGTAYDWYESKRRDLGRDFLLCADAALAQIERTPDLYAVVHRAVRRALLRRFPFADEHGWRFTIAEIDFKLARSGADCKGKDAPAAAGVPAPIAPVAPEPPPTDVVPAEPDPAPSPRPHK